MLFLRFIRTLKPYPLAVGILLAMIGRDRGWASWVSLVATVGVVAVCGVATYALDLWNGMEERENA